MAVDVKPYSTLVLSIDENYKVLVKSDIDGSIDVEVNGVVVKNVSFASGTSIVDIGTPNDFSQSSDTEIVVILHVKDSGGNEIALFRFPVYYIDGTNGSIEVYDYDTHEQLLCNFALVYLDQNRAYVRQYDGLTFSIPASSSLSYSKMYIEILSTKNGSKYYYATRVDKLTLGATNKIYLKKRSYFDIVIEAEIDTSKLGQFMDYIAGGLGYIVNVVNYINVSTLIAYHYYPLVKAIFNYIGLNIPVMKIEYQGDNVYKIYIRTDPVSTLVIVAIIVALIVAGVIALVIRDIYIESVRANVVIETQKTIQQNIELRKKMVEACKELATNEQEFLQCINDIDKFLSRASTQDQQLLNQMLDKYNSTKSDLDRLKDLIITGGLVAGGIIVAKYVLGK